MMITGSENNWHNYQSQNSGLNVLAGNFATKQEHTRGLYLNKAFDIPPLHFNRDVFAILIVIIILIIIN